MTPANIYMLHIHDQFDIPVWLLWLRLPLQVVLLWLIVWGSRWRRARAGATEREGAAAPRDSAARGRAAQVSSLSTLPPCLTT